MLLYMEMDAYKHSQTLHEVGNKNDITAEIELQVDMLAGKKDYQKEQLKGIGLSFVRNTRKIYKWDNCCDEEQ